MAATLKRKRQAEAGPAKKLAQKKVVEDQVDDVVVVDSNEDGEGSDKDEDEGAEASEGDPESFRKSSNKLPSASELRAINEAANLFKNNTFKYQLEALLASIRPKASYIPPLERTLQKLYTHLTSLPSISPTHPLEATGTLHAFTSNKKEGRSSPSAVAIPYPLPIPPQSTAWKVAFEPPGAMNVVGSWSDDLAVRKPDGAPFGVDVVVEMPASLFQEKDYRNSRFFYKRAFYTACLAASLVQSSFNLDVKYEAAEGDVRRTTLLLTPRKDGSEHDFHKLHAAIRIIPVLADDAPIPMHRLAPAQPNIRGAPAPASVTPLTLAPSSILTTAPAASAEETQPPTPQYNNTLALVLSRASRTRLLGAHRLAGAAPSFGDGLALLRVWANQRGFGAGAGCSGGEAQGNGAGSARNYCVRGFEGLGAWWACVLEVLIFGEEPTGGTGKAKNRYKRPLVGKGLSSYQLFRAALDFLAKHDFESEAVFMKVMENGQKWDHKEWTAHHAAVFVDATGTVNMLSSVSASSLQLLRHDAKSTLHLLNTGEDPFSAVFLTDMREPHARFDAVIRINLGRIRHQTYTSLDFPSTQAATLHSLASTVRKALGTRAHAVVPLQPHSPPRPLTAAHPLALSTLTLGVIFDPAHATRLVDHGPPASTPEVEAFRAFWGPKAELRRFKDGSILESCVWDEGVAHAEDREGVPARIVRYILNHHFGLAEEDVCILAGDYGRVVVAPPVRGRREGGYRDALAAFGKVVKELKTLEDEGDVPLMLVSTKPCSPSLRYTSVFHPSPIPSSSTSSHPSTSYLPAFEIVLQLERSSQWPDDLRAIQKVKLALLESMARGLLRRNGAACRACIVLDHKASEIEDGCALEVVLDGWAFHARIGHDREVTLLQDIVGGGNTMPGQPTLPAQERQTAARALQSYRRRFVHAPAHHSAVLALHHKLPAFTYTVRLVKRWLGAHWLSARIADEAVELVCARVFLLHEGDVPACGKRGFVRVVEFLKSWDGTAYVPVYEAVSEGGAAVVGEHKVEAGKGSWRLMTVEDAGGTAWCEDVTIAVAARVRAVAKATAQCLEEGTPTFGLLFEHPTTDYDFLIELDPRTVSRYWQGLRATPSVWNPSGYANLANCGDGEEAVRVGFNPAELLFRDLQTVYGDTMELFYDIHGGTTIGGVWNPSVAGPERHAWRVFLGFSSLPVTPGVQQKKEKATVIFNAEGMLAEIERMGEGLVTKITVRE